MFKSTNTTYTISCGEKDTKISAKLDLACGTPLIEIVEFGQETLNLKFHDKKSVEQLLLSIQTIKDEMDRFDPNNQSVS